MIDEEKDAQMAGQATYIPGVCNIGPRERARRRMIGVMGLVITVAGLLLLASLHAPHAWRLILAVPAFIAATGFLQDALHFCAGFGLKGLYNVTKPAGETESVTSAQFRLQDQRKAWSIFAASIVIGLAVAGACVWL